MIFTNKHILKSRPVLSDSFFSQKKEKEPCTSRTNPIKATVIIVTTLQMTNIICIRLVRNVLMGLILISITWKDPYISIKGQFEECHLNSFNNPKSEENDFEFDQS